MWMLWAVLGCGDPSGEEPSEQTAPAPLDLEAEPFAIDFGAVTLGKSGEQTLTLHNNGTSVVTIWQLETSSDAFDVTGFGSTKIAAGADKEITLEWAPSSVADLDEWMKLQVGTSYDAISELKIPIVGTVSGAELSTSDSSVELGIVSVGCVGDAAFTLSNVGTDDLVLFRLWLTNELEFTLQDDAGTEPAAGLTIPAGESIVLHVMYEPTAEHSTSTMLQIESNDALAPTRTATVDGEGRIEASGDRSWDVEGQQAVTGIINVNQIVTNSGYVFHDLMYDDFVPTFLQSLQDSKASFRVAFVMNEDGHVDGDYAYIDDSFSHDDAVAAAEDMLAGASSYGDNDTGLQTCANALDENEDWLFKEDDLWYESRLNLVVMNSDTEQSGGDAAHFVDLYDDHKDTANIVVHGVAGDVPGGCSGGGMYGEASVNLYNAVTETDGVFISICDTDWTVTATTLAAAFTGDVERFILEGNPAAWSIEVRVDGVQLFSGWTFDPTENEIVFDEATYPARGTELRVEYLMAVDCPE